LGAVCRLANERSLRTLDDFSTRHLAPSVLARSGLVILFSLGSTDCQIWSRGAQTTVTKWPSRRFLFRPWPAPSAVP